MWVSVNGMSWFVSGPSGAGKSTACGTLRSVFLHEPDEDELIANFAVREPDAGTLPDRIDEATR